MSQIQGLTLSIAHQLYENPVYFPGALEAQGVNLVTATAIPIKFKLWSSRNDNGIISNVVLKRDGLSDINCIEEGEYWVTETTASHAHILSGTVEFDAEKTILGDTYIQTFSIPVSDLKREIDFLSYEDIIETNGASLDFSSINFSMFEVNKLLYELDQVTTNAYTGRVIDLSGSEQPNTVTGGRDGIGAMNNLIVSKGITINI